MTVEANPGGSLIADALSRSQLTQAELARRAGIPRSVLNAYLRGSREPGAEALARIVAGAGCDLRIAERRPPVDPQRAEKILIQVLGLAEALPYRPRAEIDTPSLAECLRDRARA